MEKEQPQPDSLAPFSEIVRQYGEAMLGIGQLEAQVERLSQQLRRAATPDGNDPSKAPAERVEVLRERVAESAGPGDGGHAQPPGASSTGSHAGRDDELRQMELKISNMAKQLTRTNDEMFQLKGRLTRRRGHKDQARPWWSRLIRRDLPE